MISLFISLYSIIFDKFVKYYDGSNLLILLVFYVNCFFVFDNCNLDIVWFYIVFDGSFVFRNSRDNVFFVEVKVFFKWKYKNGYWFLMMLILGNIFWIKVILY